jgi:hypothetical protein
MAEARPTQRAPDGWESPRFQTGCVAWSWFRQSGVVSSHPPAGNAPRWVAHGQSEGGANGVDIQRVFRSLSDPYG